MSRTLLRQAKTSKANLVLLQVTGLDESLLEMNLQQEMQKERNSTSVATTSGTVLITMRNVIFYIQNYVLTRNYRNHPLQISQFQMLT